MKDDLKLKELDEKISLRDPHRQAVLRIRREQEKDKPLTVRRVVRPNL